MDSSSETLSALREILRDAAATDNPAQSIVEAIDKLKDTNFELWTIIQSTRAQMLQSMNDLTIDDKVGILQNFVSLNKKT